MSRTKREPAADITFRATQADITRCKVCGLLLHCASCGFKNKEMDGLCIDCVREATYAQA